MTGQEREGANSHPETDDSTERPTVVGGVVFDRPTLVGDTLSAAQASTGGESVKRSTPPPASVTAPLLTNLSDSVITSVGANQRSATTASPSSDSPPAVPPVPAFGSSASKAITAPNTSGSVADGQHDDSFSSPVSVRHNPFAQDDAPRSMPFAPPTEILVLPQRLGKYLLGARADDADGEASIIRGRPKRGESLRDCALRLCEEQCGLKAKDAALVLVSNPSGQNVSLGFTVHAANGPAQVNSVWRYWGWVDPSILPPSLEADASRLIVAAKQGARFVDVGSPDPAKAEREISVIPIGAHQVVAAPPSASDLEAEQRLKSPPKPLAVEALTTGMLGAGALLLDTGIFIRAYKQHVWSQEELSPHFMLFTWAILFFAVQYLGFERPAPTKATWLGRAALSLVFGTMVGGAIMFVLVGMMNLREAEAAIAMMVLGAMMVGVMRGLTGKPHSTEMPVRVAAWTFYASVAFICLYVTSSTVRDWFEPDPRAVRRLVKR